MRLFHVVPLHRTGPLMMFAAAAVAGCSSDSVSSVDDEPLRTPGIEYSAQTSELRFDGSPAMLVTLSIENTSILPVTLTYPAGCPVRIRLYRPSDNALVYDETRLECSVPDPISISISPQDTRSLGSGFRGMVTIVGDSLLYAAYRVVAVPQTEGDAIFEVPAGTIVLKQ